MWEFCSGKYRNQSHGVTQDIRQGWNAMKPLPTSNTLPASEKKEKTWENLRNMEKVVYLCSAIG